MNTPTNPTTIPTSNTPTNPTGNASNTHTNNTGSVSAGGADSSIISGGDKGSAVLAFGFIAAIAMWTVAYFSHLPVVMAPSWVTGVGMIAVLVISAYMAGRYAGKGWKGGAMVGIISATINLLVLGSLLSREGAPSALIYLPGLYLASAVVAAGAASFGRLSYVSPGVARSWHAAFAWAAVVATWLLLIAGGLVTGADAGLSVPDWPRTFGSNMFLYPLSRMTGAIYFEHAHRLYGSLVGITTITLAIETWRTDKRKWLRVVVGLAILAVVLQGVMGGYRVALAHTGEGIAVSTPADETTISAVLRVVHGVFGQLFFALMVFIATAASQLWYPRISTSDSVSADNTTLYVSARTDRLLTRVFLLAVIVQLILGTLVRHLDILVMGHVSFAVVVGCLAYAAGGRAWLLSGKGQFRLKRTGLILVIVISLQLLLGLAAYVVTTMADASATPSAGNVTLSTAHQATGAAVLGIAVVLLTLVHRLPVQEKGT
ncbi:MAG TPA: hypothetical protein ENJ06_01890 [Phycisphaeraceae bacterium]|nr:hypothetical protein [Phycisphaeraceae bacterium]